MGGDQLCQNTPSVRGKVTSPAAQPVNFPVSSAVVMAFGSVLFACVIAWDDRDVGKAVEVGIDRQVLELLLVSLGVPRADVGQLLLRRVIRDEIDEAVLGVELPPLW